MTPSITFRALGFAALLSCASLALAAPPLDCTPQTQVDVSKVDADRADRRNPRECRDAEVHPRPRLQLLQSGRSVILALERDGNEQEGFNRFLDSDGGPAARDQLLQAASGICDARTGAPARRCSR